MTSQSLNVQLYIFTAVIHQSKMVQCHLFAVNIYTTDVTVLVRERMQNNLHYSTACVQNARSQTQSTHARQVSSMDASSTGRSTPPQPPRINSLGVFSNSE